MGIYVWGTGCGASELTEKGLETDRITAFLDSHPMGQFFLEKPVLRPEQAKIGPEDLILITTRHADAVAARCRELDIPEENLLFLKNYAVLTDRNRSRPLAEAVLGKELLARLLPPQYVIPRPASLEDSVLNGENDYVRIAALELLTRQIRDLPGDVAELGVYQGAFARHLNRLMPRRTLYLFDSFEGFDPAEGAREKDRATCTDAFLQAHRHTEAQRVWESMPNPRSVVMKVGYFPQSLEGLEARFCLVILDADFRDSTLAGLRYFWPRLVAGGYLILHDWGSPRLTGVREAVSCYEQELGWHLPCVPIPDLCGSLILCK